MSDPLYDLLVPHLPRSSAQDDVTNAKDSEASAKYLSRLLSLRLSDLTTTEPQSLSQANHSNNVSLQALSSRSHKSTIASTTHLSTLQSSLPSLTLNIDEVRQAVPSLDEAAVTFASTYARSRENAAVSSSTTVPSSSSTAIAETANATLQARKDSMLLARQSGNLTDILELPALLSTAITSAAANAASSGSGANYSQALDLFAHIKRLSIIYPDSALVRSVQAEAEQAMKSMTTNLLANLRSQNIRLASAIRTVGWLRRVVPELTNQVSSLTVTKERSTSATGVVSPITLGTGTGTGTGTVPDGVVVQENSFGALFLVSRLHTFLSMTEALAPLRDLADQETERRLSGATNPNQPSSATSSGAGRPGSTTTTRRLSISTSTTTTATASSSHHGTQTERYLKRYIEIFREQSFGSISMYRNIFPLSSSSSSSSSTEREEDDLSLPSALQQFPFRLVEIFIQVLRTYMPNITDPAARESLLMQVLYTANSLGRLGADFSLMIALLDDEDEEQEVGLESSNGDGDGDATTVEEKEKEKEKEEPEWARIIRKHRVQAARLDALSASSKGQSPSLAGSGAVDVAVR